MPDYPGTNVEDAWSKLRSLVMGMQCQLLVIDRGSSLIGFMKAPM